MAVFDPDLQDCFDYPRVIKKFDDSCESSNISKMAANLKLCYSHVLNTVTLNLLDRTTSNMPSRFRDIDLSVIFV